MEKVAKKSVWFEEKSRFYTVSGKQNRVFHKVFQVFSHSFTQANFKNYPYKKISFQLLHIAY